MIDADTIVYAYGKNDDPDNPPEIFDDQLVRLIAELRHLTAASEERRRIPATWCGGGRPHHR